MAEGFVVIRPLLRSLCSRVVVLGIRYYYFIYELIIIFCNILSWSLLREFFERFIIQTRQERGDNDRSFRMFQVSETANVV